MTKLLGILGGMGPRASADFIGTIYDLCTDPKEQAFPKCVLYSDPSIPDRTAAILNGDEMVVLRHLKGALELLCQMQVDKIVIACVTSHYFIPRLPITVQQKVISLLDVIFDEVMKTKRKHLLLCTNGARRVRLFESDRRWRLSQQWIMFPNHDDQLRIHDFIYNRLKTNVFCESILDTFESLRCQYNVESFVMGCTELHGLAKRLKALDGPRPYNFIDPLFSIAMNIKQYV